MNCPFCKATLLFSEDRGPHCDGCDEYENSFAPESGSVLSRVNARIKDFDMELWREQDSSCLVCNTPMFLKDGSEWPDDPRLLLCWDCMSNLCSELLETNPIHDPTTLA